MSADAVYEANSTIASSSIYGFLPSGMSYSLNGNYANAAGNRNSLDFDSYELFAGVTVRQPLLRNFWVDPGRHIIRLGKQNVKFTEHGLRFLAMDVINRVEQAYYELAYAQEVQRVQSDLVRTRQGLVEATRKRIANGVATMPDEQVARAQLASAATDLNGSFTGLALAENELRTQMGDAFTNQVHTRWNATEPLLLLSTDFDLRRSWRMGSELRPDLAQMRVDLETANYEIRFRRNQLFPSIDLTASYGRRGASAVQDVPPFTPEASLGDAAAQIRNGDAPRHMFGLIVTVPLSRQAERSSFRSSKRLREQAEIRLKQKEELVFREISDALHSARTAYDRAMAARESVEFSRAALEAEERRMAGGTSSIFFILQLQNDLAAAQLVEARARADYNKALAQLRFVEGGSLERKGVAVQ